MPTISRKTWLIFGILAAGSLLVWRILTYPQLAFIDLTVTRPQALDIARDYLRDEYGADPETYHNAIIFHVSTEADRFLQRALGYHGVLKFFEEQNTRLFFWRVRFFRDGEKEEYAFSVSAENGRVIKAAHTIKDTDPRPGTTETAAQQRLQNFLTTQLGWNFDEWELYDSAADQYENRTEYTFSWKKKGVSIAWSDDPKAGEGKLLTGGTVSGDEITYFYRHRIDIPDEFTRQVTRLTDQGQTISSLVRLLYIMLLSFAVFQVMVQRNSLVMHSVKRFCFTLTGLLFVAHLALLLNDYQQFLFYYPTSSSLQTYLWRLALNYTPNIFLVTIGVLMPSLAGETLHYAVFREKPAGRFLHYLRTTLWTRTTACLIVLGYFAAAIMAGVQTLAFELGQRYLGVWIEHTWMSQMSSSAFPMLSALCLGLVASFSEEIGYRIFGISLGKKYLRSAGAAVLMASLLWGFGHTFYQVFPMWFRGIEVTILGLFLGAVYLRFGIVPVLTAHFVFDVFWLTAPYLLGRADAASAGYALILLMLPLGVSIAAYLGNRQAAENPLLWTLNPHQQFNLQVLKTYLLQPGSTPKCADQWKAELIRHGWDIAVVERALKEMERQTPS